MPECEEPSHFRGEAPHFSKWPFHSDEWASCKFILIYDARWRVTPSQWYALLVVITKIVQKLTRLLH